MKKEETDAAERMLSKIGEVYEGLYEQSVDFTHFVYALTGLYRDPTEVALLISKQICEMPGGSDNAVWLSTGSQSIQETARNGKIVAQDKCRTLDWNVHSEVKRAILGQRVVWAGADGNLNSLLPDFEAPVLFPIKGSTNALGFIVLHHGDKIDTEKYQHIALFASTVLEMSDLFYRLEHETKKSQSLEISLRKERDTAAMYLDVADVMLLGLDVEGKVELINRKGSQILGHPSEEILGQNWFECFVKTGDRERLKSVFAEIMVPDAHSTKYLESRLVTRNGDERTIAWRVTRVSDGEGRVRGTLSSGDDISDLRKVEKEKDALQSQLLQSQKMEAIGTLAAGIAHDFNNMLQVILGYSDMLLNEKDKDEPEYAQLQKIVTTALQAKDLVQKIRLFSRKADIQPVSVDLNHQLTELTKFLSHTLLKTIDIDVHLAENLAIISADPALMDQMVTNLAINASEAMPDGGRLTIETQDILLDEDFCTNHVGAKTGPHVLLTISDTGRGMSQELMERIFDPFFSTKQRDFHRGTGLGLSIIKGIVDEHSGYITVESEVGKGTTFKIYFPILTIQDEPPTRLETKIEVTTEPGETILLVEDEELVRDLGIRFLERFGYKVIAVRDGLEAVEVYAKEQENVALVILDIVMPRMDGKACLQELLKINPGVKVLISSGVAQDDRVKEVVDLGAKGSLLKPYGMKVLQEKVRELLDAKE